MDILARRYGVRPSHLLQSTDDDLALDHACAAAGLSEEARANDRAARS